MEFRFEKNDRGPIINIEAMGELISNAASAAMADAADMILTQGKQNIASAGFSRDFSDAMTVSTVTPNGLGGPYSITARVNIPFAIVFEYGAVSQGDPLLWIPLPGVPKMIGARKMTARLYKSEIGPLFMVKTGRYPMLYGYAGGAAPESSLKANPSRSKRLTTAQLKQGGGAKIPLFIGLQSSTIAKRLNILEICQDAEKRIPEFYSNYAGGL
jgi:hypothetical protein